MRSNRKAFAVAAALAMAVFTGCGSQGGTGDGSIFQSRDQEKPQQDAGTEILPGTGQTPAGEESRKQDAGTETGQAPAKEAVTDVADPVYYLTGKASGDETAVDVSQITVVGEVSGWQITTARNRKLVEQTIVAEAPSRIRTEGADSYEIAPVYSYQGILGTSEEEGYRFELPEDTYSFTITGISGGRRDVYVNGQMLVNNFWQDGNTPDSVKVNDIIVMGGAATVYLDDCKGNGTTRIEVAKAPSVVNRARKVYVIGDSLVCIYYNGGTSANKKKTGIGQMLDRYLTGVEVVDLGNSGQTAEGLISTAFTQVTGSARPGDIVLFEAGYNDRNYSDEGKMKAALQKAVEETQQIGVDLIFFSPNASPHDYKDTVSWTSYMEDVAKETGTAYIDLGELSFSFLHDLYGDDTETIAKTYVVSDTLHSSFLGANKWASILAGKLAEMGYADIVNANYEFTFRDVFKNDIVCRADAPERDWEDLTFTFGTRDPGDGSIQVGAEEYEAEKGYGFYNIRTMSAETDFVTGTRNFCFQVKVPDGNYNVTMDTTAETVTVETVRSVTAKTGIEKTDNRFDVAVCDGVLDLTFPADSVLKTVKILRMEAKQPLEKPYIYVIGDSTAKNTADGAMSWGNVVETGDVPLPASFGGFANHGMAGRDSVNYYNQGRLEAVLLALHPGDYVTVNMGINSRETGEKDAYYTLMKEYYVKGIMQRGAVPVIVTATPDGPVGSKPSALYNASTGEFTNDRGDGARNRELRQIAQEMDLAVIELGQWGRDWMNTLTQEDVAAYNREQGTEFTTVLEMVQDFYVDHNHYKQYLGIQIAEFILGELGEMHHE